MWKTKIVRYYASPKVIPPLIRKYLISDAARKPRKQVRTDADSQNFSSSVVQNEKAALLT